MGGIARTLSQVTLARWRVWILITKTREYVLFDSWLYRKTAAAAGLAAGFLLLLLRRGRPALRVLSAVHRAGYMTPADRAVESALRRAFSGSRAYVPLARAIHAHVQDTSAAPPRLSANPSSLLGPLAMVLRSPRAGRKGVILLQYNYVFPLFAKAFRLDHIAQQYHIVLEPSWSGYCTGDVLSYAGAGRVYVQAYEPRDRQFVEALDVGFQVVPTSTNWWVDHRTFVPLPHVRKDVDLIMVAGWGGYKRHSAFFEGLARLRRLHPRVRVVLVGYGLGMSSADIVALAEVYGVADTLELFEHLSQQDVNVQLNRGRVNVIWSRKEGVNRAIVEGMFAGLPCIVREGFNYGHPYAYVNESTGAFAAEHDFPRVALEMIEKADRMRPREWVLENMSCQRATRILQLAIDGEDGEPGDLAVKTNGLYGMHYWNDADATRFAGDYEFLRSQLVAPQTDP
jgi:glycosyltransferase involved in cell wall biosynthesis